jgi:hypothetical protein
MEWISSNILPEEETAWCWLYMVHESDFDDNFQSIYPAAWRPGEQAWSVGMEFNAQLTYPEDVVYWQYATVPDAPIDKK